MSAAKISVRIAAVDRPTLGGYGGEIEFADGLDARTRRKQVVEALRAMEVAVLRGDADHLLGATEPTS